MVEGAPGSVLTRGARFDQKWPITRLGQQKFTRELFENTICKRAALLCMLARSFNHPLGRGLQRRINPGVTRIEPDTEMAVLTPCRRGRANDLLCRMRGQVFTRCRKEKIGLCCRLANEVFQKQWPFEPPVPEQFRVKRGNYDRLEIKFVEFFNLLAALVQKVAGM